MTQIDLLYKMNESWMFNVTAKAYALHDISGNSTLDPTAYDGWREFKFIALGMLIHFGLICNTIALAVFATSHLKDTVPGRYFMALALADNIVLVGEFLLWLNHSDSRGPRIGLKFINEYDFWCKFVYFIRYWSRMLSSWITVTITLERFLTVTFPFRMMMASSNLKKPLIIISAEALICAALASFAPILLTVSPRRDGGLLCSYTEARLLYKPLLVTIIGFFGELLLPSLIVLVFTILLIRNMSKASKLRRRHLMQESGSSDKQPTFALLAIAIVFLVTRSPYMLTFFLNDGLRVLKIHQHHIYRAYIFTYVLAVVNYSFNFLLFCITGATFRAKLCNIFRCKSTKSRSRLSDSTVLSSVIYSAQNSKD